MVPEKLELHLAQTEFLLKQVESQVYSDKRKQRHVAQLRELFTNITKANYKGFSEEDLNLTRICINLYLLSGCEFLLHSSDNSKVPKELLFCIENVLNDWLLNPSEHIIVTSLSKKHNDYSFQSIPEFWNPILIPFLQDKFNIKFEFSLLNLNMPEHLVGDYLANVILFHEIGHFVDRKYKIVEKIFEAEATFVAFKRSPDPSNRAFIAKQQIYYKEFFADVFAAQYIGDTCSKYLSYISYGSGDGNSHPSTIRRIATVEDFNLGRANEMIDLFQRYSARAANRNTLVKRYSDINDSFAENKILKIASPSEVPSLFIKGWECWLSSGSKFPRNLDTGLLDGYVQLNDLIQTSISTYQISLDAKENSQVEAAPSEEKLKEGQG